MSRKRQHRVNKKLLQHGLQTPSGCTLCKSNCLKADETIQKVGPELGNYFEKLAPPSTWKDKWQELQTYMWSHSLLHRSTLFIPEGGSTKVRKSLQACCNLLLSVCSFWGDQVVRQRLKKSSWILELHRKTTLNNIISFLKPGSES